MKTVPFEIFVPAVKPGQQELRKTIHVPVREEYGEEILTVEAHEIIDRVKMQATISRLVDAVRELTGADTPNAGTDR